MPQKQKSYAEAMREVMDQPDIFDAFVDNGDFVPPTRWELFATHVRYRVAELVCRIFGHKWAYDDEASYANAESAAETFYCTRCGLDNEIIYY